MDVNFFAPVELIRLAIPQLTAGNQPVIVNISSMTGRKAMPAWSEYSASKHALCGITEALRGEMARFNIDTVLIIPGLTRTGLQKDMLRNEGRAKIDYDAGMEPSFVAAKILKAIRNGKQELVIGTDAKLMLLVNRFLPRWLDRRIASKVTRLYRDAN
jgi:short-subunit dehydrogenase